MHHAAYAELGLPHTYEAIRCPAGSLSTTLVELRQAGYRGVNITVPLKEEALEACHADAFALRCGAVNTIDLESGVGINTDGPGFVESIRGTEGRRVLLLGAGGALPIFAVALLDAGYEVAIWNRSSTRAEALAQTVGADWTETIPSDGYEIAINATSSSLKNERLKMTFQSDRTYIDLYYLKEGDTLFVADARAADASAMDGRELLVAQGALSFEFWLGIPAPRQAMRRAVGL